MPRAADFIETRQTEIGHDDTHYDRRGLLSRCTANRPIGSSAYNTLIGAGLTAAGVLGLNQLP